jgi:hypothetical protein
MPTYNGNGQIEAGILHIQIAFGNDAEFTKVMQPRNRPLDEPAKYPQPAAMFGPPPGQHRFDAPTSQDLPQSLRIISPVAVDPLRAVAGPAAFATHRGNTLDQTRQQLTIRHVRPTDVRHQRDPVGIGHAMVLESRTATTRGIGATFLARAQRPDDATIDQRTGPIDLVGPLQFGQQPFVEAEPNAGVPPGLKPA